MLGIAAELRHAALDVGIERASAIDVARAGEHHLGGFRGKLAAGVG